MIFLLLCIKEILLVKFSWMTLVSNYHGLPKIMWVASMGTTSHKIVSLYCLMDRLTSTCLLTIISPSSLSHWSLNGLGWSFVSKFNLVFSLELGTMVQLPQSTMHEHIFPWMKHLVWKLFSLWVWSKACVLLPISLIIINKSPFNASTSLFSSSFSSSLEGSLSISPFINLTIFSFVGHSKA